jgi:hypothetical protein
VSRQNPTTFVKNKTFLWSHDFQKKKIQKKFQKKKNYNKFYVIKYNIKYSNE